MQIHFQTEKYVPPQQVSLRAGTTVPTQEYHGYYRDTWWTFDVADDLDTFVFALDSMTVSAEFATATHRLVREPEVAFAAPDLTARQGFFQEKWFPVGADDATWDVVVVGTGMGGGTLLYELAMHHPELRVLGIEAGPLVLPTHAGNLPRRVQQANRDQVSTLWGLYSDIGSQPFSTTAPWQGYEVFALGGRSLLWGGLCPRLSPTDAQDWLPDVISELGQTYYPRAVDLMNVGSPTRSSVQEWALNALGGVDVLTAEHDVDDARVAVELEQPDSWRISTGMFSTADLLLSTRLAVPRDGDPHLENWPPYIHLGELVTRVERADDHAVDDSGDESGDDSGGGWLVRSTTVADDRAHVYRARTVVLAAGAVETARLAVASGVGGPKAGVGLTEHDMWWVHFEVPVAAVPDVEKSAKILAVPRAGADQSWNMLVEVNVDLNEERLPERELRQSFLQVDPDCVGAQIVFLCRNALRDEQCVRATDGARWPQFNQPDPHTLPPVQVQLDPDASADPPVELQAVSDAVIAALGGHAIDGITTTLRRAGRGFVAHEMGSMRMPGANAPDSVVDADLQVRSDSGIYVCDNSLFPACPAANPSLTLVAMAIRLADHLAGQLASQLAGQPAGS